MDITLTFHGVDFASWLSTYQVDHEINYKKVITTLDGTEHSYPGTRRPIVTFSFLPISDEKASQYYKALSVLVASATYFDTWLDATRTADMRVVSDLSAAFGLRSIDGHRYHKGGLIQLRGVEVIA